MSCSLFSSSVFAQTLFSANEDQVLAKKFIDQPLDQTLPMTWNQQSLASKIKPALDQLNVTLSVPTGPAPHNNYLCNEISDVALEASLGRKIDLAGHLIRIEPHFTHPPVVGFFHYPSANEPDPQTLGLWSQVLLNLAGDSLGLN